MHEHHGLAAVELGVELVLVGMAEVALPGMAEQADALKLQRVERVGRLADRGRDVGHRQQREGAEPVRMIGDHFRRVVVALAGDADRLVDIAEAGAGRGDRIDHRGDVHLVHQLELQRQAPGRPRVLAAAVDADLRQRALVHLGHRLLVHVDQGAEAHGSNTLEGGTTSGTGGATAFEVASAPQVAERVSLSLALAHGRGRAE